MKDCFISFVYSLDSTNNANNCSKQYILHRLIMESYHISGHLSSLGLSDFMWNYGNIRSHISPKISIPDLIPHPIFQFPILLKYELKELQCILQIYLTLSPNIKGTIFSNWLVYLLLTFVLVNPNLSARHLKISITPSSELISDTYSRLQF